MILLTLALRLFQRFPGVAYLFYIKGRPPCSGMTNWLLPFEGALLIGNRVMPFART